MKNEEEKSSSKDLMRSSIEELLSDDAGLPIDNGTDLPAFQTTRAMDYQDVRNNSHTKAQKLVGSLLKFYLSADAISKNEYITAAARLKSSTIGELMNSLSQMEHAIETLMRTIDSGELAPRMFEVLGGLQKTKLEIMREANLVLMQTEESMKRIKNDIDIFEIKGDTTEVTKADPNEPMRGTRNIMAQIQEELQDKNIVDDDIEDDIEDVEE